MSFHNLNLSVRLESSSKRFSSSRLVGCTQAKLFIAATFLCIHFCIYPFNGLFVYLLLRLSPFFAYFFYTCIGIADVFVPFCTIDLIEVCTLYSCKASFYLLEYIFSVTKFNEGHTIA